MRARFERLLCLGAAGVLAGAASAAYGHHSIAAVYDGDDQRTLVAIVTEFQFVRPHPKILVDVDGDGGTRQWTLEMDNRWELAELGFEPGVLEPGDRIVVTGSVSRREPRALYVRRLERPADGFSYEHHR